MTMRITDRELLKKLFNEKGPHSMAQLEIAADISRSTIRDMLAGRVPSDSIRKKVAAFFERDVSVLFPLVKTGEEAA